MPAQALETSDDRSLGDHYLQNLFEEAPIAYHEADTAGIIRRVNRAECELLGLAAADIVGRLVWDLFVPEQREGARERFREMMAGVCRPQPFEVAFLHANGSVRTGVVHPRLIEDASGTVVGVLSARLDTTEHTEQNRLAALRADVTNATITFGSVDAALQHCVEAVVWRLDAAFARIWILNPTDRMLELRASAGLYNHLDGAHSRVPVGQFKIGLIAEERRPHLTNAVAGDPRVGDQEWAKREGMVAFAGYPLLLNEEVLGVLAMFSRRYLTDAVFEALGQTALEVAVLIDRKTAEEVIRKSEQRYRNIVETAAEGIWNVSPNLGTTFVNRPMAEMLGLTAADCLTHPVIDFFFPEDHQAMKERHESLSRGNKETFDVRLRRADGTELWTSFCAAASLSEDGSLIGILNMVTDITNRKQAEEAQVRDISERKQLESQLSQAQKLESIGQLAAGVAHEINTPIQYIGDNGRFLLDGFNRLRPMLDLDTLSAEYREDAEYLFEEIPKAAGQLLEGVETVARIVRAMKEFSHPGPIEKTPVDLNQGIQSTIVVSRNEWKYVAEMIEDLDPELPPVPCVGGEINQTVLNLIVNAAHAIADAVRGTPALGTITISTHREGDWAELRVRDTGTGIPESARGKIFDPFFTTKEVGKGTGQGLSIAHTAIVKNHGGTIHFETETGAGTTFIVRLPIAGA